MNPFFGRIGDVWKHLLLGEVVQHRKPTRYLESHAGSAFYPLSHSTDRDFGVYTFLDVASRSPVLERTAYHRKLRELPRDEEGYPSTYLGSSALVMTLMGRATSYDLWDFDPESVRDLQKAATDLGISDVARVKVGDGLDGLLDTTEALEPSEVPRVLAVVDPFDPTTSSAGHGLSSVDVSLVLAGARVPLVYWYGLDDESEIGWAWQALGEQAATDDVWAGEIAPSTSDAPDLFEDGMRGCGVVCLNCGSSREPVRLVAQALVDAYQEERPRHSDAPGLRYREFGSG